MLLEIVPAMLRSSSFVMGEKRMSGQLLCTSEPLIGSVTGLVKGHDLAMSASLL